MTEGCVTALGRGGCWVGATMSKAKGEDKNHFWRLGTVDKETNKTGWTSSRMAKAVNIDSAERNYYVTMW